MSCTLVLVHCLISGPRYGGDAGPDAGSAFDSAAQSMLAAASRLERARDLLLGQEPPVDGEDEQTEPVDSLGAGNEESAATKRTWR